jgi:21S rRNA (uridine2791-2'-O)-methyltransferase
MFAIDTLRPGGSFVCKFFTGSEDKDLEERIKTVFKVVKREKPPASRKASKEMYLIGLNKLKDVSKESVFNY